jgi:hypothetical protein
MKRMTRRGLATAACGLLLAAGLSVTLPAHAKEPAEVAVIPADQLTTYQNDLLWFAGETGFLHQRTLKTPVLWTTYADHATRVVPDFAGLALTRLVPAGHDAVSFSYAVPGHSSTTSVSTFDLATMTWRQYDRPAGLSANIYGDHELVWSGLRPAAAAPELRKVAADGTFTGVPLSGIPDGTTWYTVKAGDASSVVLTFGGPDGVRYGLLDLASGRIAILPGGVTGVSKVLLTDDHVGLLTAKAMNTFARAALLDGTATGPVTIPLPTVDVPRTMLAGDDVIVAPPASDPRPALRYPASGAAPTQAVPLAQGTAPNIVQGDDGVLLVGGTGPADWAVRRVTGTGQDAVLPLNAAMTNAGVSVVQGEVRHVEAFALAGEAPAYHLYNHLTVTGGATDGLAERADGGVLENPLPCESGATCVRTADGNWYGTVYLSTGSATTVRLLTRHDVYTSHVTVSLPSAGGTLVDTSLDHVIVRGAGPAQQYVAEPGYGTVTAGPVTGAGLWFNTLWTATKPGYLQPKNLTTGAAGTAVATGSACQATEVQVALRYVYWTCGDNGPAGAYDLTRKAGVALPPAQYLLGDGYVVRHDADGDLVRYDLASGDTATLGTVPRGPLADDRNVTWAVDKYSGDVAYVDADDAVHLVDPGVARSAPAAGSGVHEAGDIVGFPSAYTWAASAELSRPIDSWQLTIARAGTGTVVTTISGGPARRAVRAIWDGTVAGKPVTSGRYRYTFTATADDATATLGSGIVGVACGVPTFRSYDCNGLPSILGIAKSPAGNGHWLTAAIGGKSMVDGGYTEDWAVGTGKGQVNAIVPFGDINGDRFDDILVRKGDGSLRAYLGFGQAYFGQNKSVAVAGNFARYDALVFTGDVTGDGKADLIARDHATGALYRFAGNGKGGFGGAVRLAGAYKGYSRIIGAGDITGDGKPDLLLLAGTDLYGLRGTGTGTFGARFLVGTGYRGYNSIIGAGDVNDDGRNDLVAREPSGNLWLLPGNGHGGVGSRIKLGTGYQRFAYLY